MGSSVTLVPGEALTVKITGVPVGQASVNEALVKFTLSLKLITMLALRATPVAPLAGEVLVTVGGASVVKVKILLDTIVSGGSAVSASVIRSAHTVTVQVEPAGRLAFGSSVALVAGDVLTRLNGTASGQAIENELTLKFTLSLKLITMLPSVAKFEAPFVGEVLVTVGGASVVKLKTSLASMVSGGSALSTSLILAATTVTLQVSPTGRSLIGLISALVAPELLSVKALALPVGHSSTNDDVLKFTFSLKLMTILLLVATLVAPSAGIVLVTLGGASVVKLKTKSASKASGGSMLSASVMPAAKTVTVQVEPVGRLLVGSSVTLLAGDASTILKVTTLEQAIANELALKFTLSLKLITMLVLVAKFVAPSEGVVLVTVGGSSFTVVKLNV